MKDNKTIDTAASKKSVPKESEVKATSSVPIYDPDDYMKQYYLNDEIFYHDERCFSCKHWLRSECGAPNGPCSYESF